MSVLLVGAWGVRPKGEEVTPKAEVPGVEGAGANALPALPNTECHLLQVKIGWMYSPLPKGDPPGVKGDEPLAKMDFCSAFGGVVAVGDESVIMTDERSRQDRTRPQNTSRFVWQY